MEQHHHQTTTLDLVFYYQLSILLFQLKHLCVCVCALANFIFGPIFHFLFHSVVFFFGTRYPICTSMFVLGKFDWIISYFSSNIWLELTTETDMMKKFTHCLSYAITFPAIINNIRPKNSQFSILLKHYCSNNDSMLFDCPFASVGTSRKH